MSDDMIQSIKDIAHKVSEGYLIFGKDMNNAIIDSYLKGEINNDEILKRICEHANQNVYLSMFNDPSINKANISFTLADFNKIIPIIRESEIAMNELKTPPVDFRNKSTGLTQATAAPENNENDLELESDITQAGKSVEKQAQLHEIIQYRNVLKNFIDKVSMMKCAEEKVAEAAFEKMRRDAKSIVAKGDSFGDLAKIASRSIKEIGGNFIKVASAYDMIQKELVENNYRVNIEFTKLSSMKLNPSAEILKPVSEFYLSIEKIAGFSEMYNNASKILDVFDKTIGNEIKK